MYLIRGFPTGSKKRNIPTTIRSLPVKNVHRMKGKSLSLSFFIFRLGDVIQRLFALARGRNTQEYVVDETENNLSRAFMIRIENTTKAGRLRKIRR